MVNCARLLGASGPKVGSPQGRGSGRPEGLAQVSGVSLSADIRRARHPRRLQTCGSLLASLNAPMHPGRVGQEVLDPEGVPSAGRLGRVEEES